jgi:hypothetical protein
MSLAVDCLTAEVEGELESTRLQADEKADRLTTFNPVTFNSAKEITSSARSETLVKRSEASPTR